MTAFCENDPINAVDPLELETFVAVDDAKKEIVLHMLLHYVPAEGATFEKGALAKLASQHETWAEELLGTYTYGGANAPHVTKTVQQCYGLRGREKLYKEVEKDLGPKYKGYKVRLNVITTTDPEPADVSKKHASPYSTFEIHQKRIHANARTLSRRSAKETVFHEYMHHLNLLDEYPRPGYKYNWCEVFKKHWKRDPEADAIMTCGGTTLYDRYMEAALFDIDNLERKPVSKYLDEVFYLDPGEYYFQKNPEMFERVQKIIEGAE